MAGVVQAPLREPAAAAPHSPPLASAPLAYGRCLPSPSSHFCQYPDVNHATIDGKPAREVRQIQKRFQLNRGINSIAAAAAAASAAWRSCLAI